MLGSLLFKISFDLLFNLAILRSCKLVEARVLFDNLEKGFETLSTMEIAGI